MFSAMFDNIIVIFEVFIRRFIWLVVPACPAQEILMLRKEHDFLDITGVPSIWVPDNLKSAVTKACRY